MDAPAAPLRIRTPWGDFSARLTPRGVAALALPGAALGGGEAQTNTEAGEEAAAGRLRARLEAELNEYLAGGREDFDLPLDPAGATAFRQRVWEALRTIPYGETRTYGEVARVLGGGAARAVGQACGANPLPLLVPCHRVVAVSGPGGFGSGLAWKHRLLELERAASGSTKRTARTA